MSKYKPDLRKKEYQISVRIPIKMKDSIIKRLNGMGFNNMAEYVRHIIINDINGLDGIVYGQEQLS